MGEIGHPQRRVEVVPETPPVREAPKPAPAPVPQKAPEKEPVPAGHWTKAPIGQWSARQ